MPDCEFRISSCSKIGYETTRVPLGSGLSSDSLVWFVCFGLVRLYNKVEPTCFFCLVCFGLFGLFWFGLVWFGRSL